MWNAFHNISKVVLTIAGLLLLPLTIYRYSGSMLLGTVAALVVFLILAVGAFVYRLPMVFQRRAGISRYNTSFIVSRKHENVEIGEDYLATVKTKKEFIFQEMPDPKDLVDVIELFKGEELDKSIYESSDSNIDGVKNTKPNTVAIFWQPKDKIVPNVPYLHETLYRCPSPYGEDWFWQGNHVDANTGIVEWTFKTPIPVEKAIAFRMPWYSVGITERKIFKFALRKQFRNCAQPTISDNKMQVKWLLQNPKRGTYICFVAYKDGIKNYFEKKKKKKGSKKGSPISRPLSSTKNLPCGKK